MIQSVIMEQEDLLRMKNAEIAALQEQLQNERIRREAIEQEAELSFRQAQALAKENKKLKEQVASWTAEADAQAALKQQFERQGIEL